MMTAHEIQRIIDMPEKASKRQILSVAEELYNQRQTNRLLAQESRAMRYVLEKTTAHIENNQKYYRLSLIMMMLLGGCIGFSLAYWGWT